MSRPSKRFVLPYDPEYTAHRTDSRTIRTMRLHRTAQRAAGPSLVPADTDGEAAADGPLRRTEPRRVERRHTASLVLPR